MPEMTFQPIFRGPMGALAYQQAVDAAASKLGASADDSIPGLWHAPGYPELTSGQLLAAAAQR